MAPEDTELDISEKFDQEYLLTEAQVMREIEAAVCGCDYGGTSWTTEAEAQELGRLMKLGPGREFLEVGAGSGWPALHLVQTTGCRAALADITKEGLRIAAERAARDGTDDRCRFSLAGGDALPFGAGEFDAIGHSDVLCCLEAKRETLKECRRVIGADGIMAFSVIYIAPDLSPADHDRAAAAGPPFIEAPASYPEMLAGAGWNIEHRADLTAEFAATARRLSREVEARGQALGELMGEAESREFLVKVGETLRAIEDGPLGRDMYAASPRPTDP